MRKDDALAAVAVSAGIAAAVALTALTRRRQDPAAHSFRDDVVVITGGSRGLGLALAAIFAREGARVVLLARDPDELRHALGRLGELGASDVTARPCDIRQQSSIDDVVAEIMSTYGRLDVLINNAGVIQSSPVENASIDDFTSSLETHFWGPLHLIRAAAPHMARQGGGRIVNIASIGGRLAIPHLIPYCVGKSALVALSEGLHAEFHKYGIAVTTATPALVRTGSHRNVVVRGQHRKEATWFALAASSPLASLEANRAARVIVEATRARRATVSPGWAARAAELTHALLPEPMSALAAWIAETWLPAAGASGAGDDARLSLDVDTGLASVVFPTQAARRFNQAIASDELANG